MGRTTLSEVEIGGETIPPGQRIFCLIQSGNRDEREFERPDSFDIHRNSRRHLGLGHGPHHCIGAATVRMQARIALEELIGRCPDFTVDFAKGRFATGNYVRRYVSMPFRATGAR